jgi:L-rhamnose mutarotase
MSKVIFSVQYEVLDDKREEYIRTINELKNLLKAEGLENYSVYEIKGKSNHFLEQYLFSSEEAFENFDDNQDERLNILINKISEFTKNHTTKYSTLIELI